jgi:hypothetical protein
MNNPILIDVWNKAIFEKFFHEYLFAPKFVRRSWRERLLSWPWRPWRKTELDWSKWEREPGPCIDQIKIGVPPRMIYETPKT